ncbi:MAG: hypothetical protein JSW30_00255 [Dehalococcoidia bacterium]|nr:MAG: hypothetical protein JSW30_00255 [Dehalococcoidia bacterium]
MSMMRVLSILVVLVGLVGIVMGTVFVGLGMAKNNQLVEAMQVEQVRLSLEEGAEPTLVDTSAEAEAAGDLIREHRRGIAITYQELLGEGRFDPTNPQQLSYAQAMNMENYLYLAVIGFGLIQAVMASGAFMIITGVALGGTGLVLYQLS